MDDAGSAGPDRRRGNPGVPLGTGRAGHLRLLLAVARWRGSLTAPDGDGIRRYVLFQHACDRRVPAGRGEGSRTVRRAGADSRRVASSVSSARCHRTSTRYVLSTTCSCSPSIVPGFGGARDGLGSPELRDVREATRQGRRRIRTAASPGGTSCRNGGRARPPARSWAPASGLSRRMTRPRRWPPLVPRKNRSGQADRLLTSVGRARGARGPPARIDAALTSISADAERLAANDQLTTTALPAAREAITQGTAARDQRVALARWRGRLGAPKSREKPR